MDHEGSPMHHEMYSLEHPSVKMNKRQPHQRIFVNRGLHLNKIKFYGFDMDYTLAVYKSPVYEAMGFDKLKERLIHIGYPEEIRKFQYDPSFPVRGLWFDKTYGNLLKVDSYGNILVAIHGFTFLKPHEVSELYPNKYIQLEDKRLYVFNTLFNIPETYMIACVIDYFANNKDFVKSRTGMASGLALMSYKSIFQDVRAAVDWVHIHGDLKSETMANLEKFVHRDERLPILLDRLSQFGAKVVLITNSEYEYTNKIMTYLMDFPAVTGNRHWTSYWDCVVVDAKKPLFFEDGTILRTVDTKTGSLGLGHHLGPIKRGEIYSGGSCEVVSRLLGAKGNDVLYVGDHIFGDILKSKKIRGWKTFLVIPELATELTVWTNKKVLFDSLTQIECALSDVYRHLDSSSMTKPDVSSINAKLKAVVHDLDMSYGLLGSLFRSGSRQTFFASQVRRYADIYASSYLHLLYYPFCYKFRAPAMLMPHEATVDQTPIVNLEPHSFYHRSRSTCSDCEKTSPTKRKKPVTENDSYLYAETPCVGVHIHDEEGNESDEDKSNSPYSYTTNGSGSPDNISMSCEVTNGNVKMSVS